MAGIPWMDPVERGSLVSSVSWKNWTNTHPQKLIYQEKLTEQVIFKLVHSFTII